MIDKLVFCFENKLLWRPHSDALQYFMRLGIQQFEAESIEFGEAAHKGLQIQSSAT